MKKGRKITLPSPHLTLIFILLAGVAVGYIFGGFFVGEPESESITVAPTDEQLEEILEEETASQEQEVEQLIEVENVSVDDDPSLGFSPEEAPITIVEFSDYQCVFCQRYFEESLETIMEDYVDTGKVHYVFRDFPLDSHPQAIPAAVAANCSGEQGKYWEMHDLLFENQEEWSFEDTDAQFLSYARELELDTEAFATCQQDSEQEEEVLHDLEQGSLSTVTQTPTIFINGKKIVGAQPMATYIAIIEKELLSAERGL